MKIRNGFVSNSSSSSFVIKNNTTKNVAKRMLKGRSEEGDSILINILDNIDDGEAIFFKSCNYDTYIFEKNGDVYVDTCNNEDWKIDTLIDEYCEEIEEDYTGKFYSLDNREYIYKTEWDECFKHKWQDFLVTEKGSICPVCLEEKKKIEKFLRSNYEF